MSGERFPEALTPALSQRERERISRDGNLEISLRPLTARTRVSYSVNLPSLLAREFPLPLGED